MSEFDAVLNGPILRTHTNRVVALLRHFKEQGRTLRDCTDPRRLGMVEGRGTLSWGGGGGTWFWIDPENDIVFVGMIQRMADPVSSEFRNRARTFVYQALTHPEK